MLRILFVILMLLWLVVVASAYTLSGFLHLLVVTALVVVLLRIRRAVI